MHRNYVDPLWHSDADWLISPKLASRYDWDSFEFTPEGEFYPCGITGQQYYETTWPDLTSVPSFVQLVPHIENEYDAFALKVLHRERQIGWVPSNSAYLLAPFVHLLIKRGSKCLVPLTPPYTSSTYDPETDESRTDFMIGVMVLPTVSYLSRSFPPPILMRDLDRAWQYLTAEEQDRIRSDGYRFNEETASRFRSIGLQVTNYPFVLPLNADMILKQYLVWCRRMIDKLTRQRDMASRNIWICEQAALGHSYRKIAAEVNLAIATVGGIKRKGDAPMIRAEWHKTLNTIPADTDEVIELVLNEYFQRLTR